MATPILLAATGELFAEKSGILNLGVEGMMLVGALVGFLGSYFTHSPWVGVLLAALAAMMVGYLHAFLSVSISTNQVISGFTIWIFAQGISDYAYRSTFGVITYLPTANVLGKLSIPLLSQIPLVGPILFEQNILVYFALIMIPVSALFMSKTTMGLKIRSVGENPKAAEVAGINVPLIRYACVIFGGAMAGLAGAFLSIADMNSFTIGMTAGRGWIAIAVVVFGSWNAYRILGGSLLFGLINALQFRLPLLGVDLPSRILLMLPYILAIGALIIIARKAKGPKALGVPYRREDK